MNAPLILNGTSLTAANELAIKRALEAAGVEFIDSVVVRGSEANERG